jgi:acyl carrier protein
MKDLSAYAKLFKLNHFYKEDFMSNILKFLKEIAVLLEEDVSALVPELRLDCHGNWDSLTVVSTIALLDQHFQVKAELQKLEHCKTIADLLQLTNKRN